MLARIPNNRSSSLPAHLRSYDSGCTGAVFSKDGSLVLDRQILMGKLGVEDDGQDLILYAISDRGVCYKAVF